MSADRTLAGILLAIVECAEERGSGSGESSLHQMTFEARDNPTAHGTRAEISSLLMYFGRSICEIEQLVYFRIYFIVYVFSLDRWIIPLRSGILYLPFAYLYSLLSKRLNLEMVFHLAPGSSDPLNDYPHPGLGVR